MNGLTLRSATKTIIYCDMVFTAAAVIPSGFLVQNSNGDQFALVANLVASGAGIKLQQPFQAIVDGAILCPAGDLITIVNPEAGLSYVAQSIILQGNGGTWSSGSIASLVDNIDYAISWGTSKTATLTAYAARLLDGRDTNILAASYNSTTDTISITPSVGKIVSVTVLNVTSGSGDTFALNLTSLNNVGLPPETTAEARIRRLQSFSIAGAGTKDAIASYIQNTVPTVTYCTVLENLTDSIDTNGTGARSIQVVCTGNSTAPEKQQIANAIWTKRSGGIPTSGTTSQTIVDSTGWSQTVYFSYTTQVSIAIIGTYSKFADELSLLPIDINGAISAALTSIFPMALGEDVLLERIKAALYSIKGLRNFVLSAPTTDTAMSGFQQAVLGTVTLTWDNTTI
jgi:hypothetical protein